MLRIGQVENTATPDGKYTDGSVAGGIAATRLRAAAFNAMQEELAHIVEAASIALDVNDMTQVLAAIRKLTLNRNNPFGDIKSDGAAAIATALTNLGALATSGGTITGNLHIKGETSTDGNISSSASVIAASRLSVGTDVLNPAAYIDDKGDLHSYKWNNKSLYADVYRRIIGESSIQAGFSGGDFSKPYMMHSNGQSVFLVTSAMAGIGIPMIGMPFYWPIDKMPNLIFSELSGMSFVKMNGASFSASLFPNLAKVFPSLVLPDTRGEFIRVWDDGRGVDPLRDMLSSQAYDTKSHTHRFLGSNGSVGNSNVLGTQNNVGDTMTYGINQPDGSTKMFLESTGGSETRPRNIAFSFIVRAA